MTGWQIQAMWEADAAAEWERLNTPDPFEGKLKAAANDIAEAVNFLDIVTDRLNEAMADLEGTPMKAKIESFFDRLEDMRIDLRIISTTYGRGERE